ncbi:VRR-NUC domain-containing protein [Rufibacter sp. H-1]|uniref:VRR-NUC domain-containing protein n=1 Tax=Rufibacter sediminis TaxID=2762756 RepID=A0ABR6VVK2_9BACT|nr:VRR-NUC domain-containing protein [Rufibacter sediminis]
MVRLEDKIQFECAQFLRRNRITFYHVPNGAKRSAAEASRLIALGLLPGVNDLVILLPGAVSVYVELKIEKGKLSKSQINFHQKISELGFPNYIIQTDCPNQAILLLADILKNHTQQSLDI